MGHMILAIIWLLTLETLSAPIYARFPGHVPPSFPSWFSTNPNPRPYITVASTIKLYHKDAAFVQAKP